MIHLTEKHGGEEELDNLLKCIGSENPENGDAFQKKCLQWLQEYYGHERIILTASGSQALELAALVTEQPSAQRIGFSDYSFPSTVNSFLKDNVTPVLIDIDASGCIDTGFLEKVIRTLSVLVVTNYAGDNLSVGRISELCRRHHVVMVEDNALGMLSSVGERPLGGWGELGVLSFQSSKPVSCGEGGALIVNDSSLWEKAQILAENGTTRALYKKDRRVPYTWTMKGINCRLSELNAAYLYGQFAHAQKDKRLRKSLAELYKQELKGTPGIRLPDFSEDWNAGMFYIVFENAKEAEQCRKLLNASGVQALAHYGALSDSAFGKTMEYEGEHRAAEFDKRMVRLPMHCNLTARNVRDICALIRQLCTSFQEIKD